MKFGMIGTNFVSDGFIQCARKIEACEIVGVCSGQYENAVKFAEKYAIPNVYHNYEAMFEDNKLEAVYIATPNSTHFTIAKYFIERKIPCFIEKPICANPIELQSLLSLAHANNTYVHDGIMPLYTKNFQKLQNQITKIGPIRSATFNFSKYSSRYDAYLNNENPTTFRRELANGAIMDLGVYIVSDAVALFGKPLNIHATATKLDNGCDGAFSAIFEYPTFNLTLSASKISNTKVISEICGEEGLIQFKMPSIINEITMFNKKGEEVITYVDDVYPFIYQINDFINNVSNNKINSDIVTHQLSYDISEVLYTIRKQCAIVFPQD